jgi:GNAT superfamily N-acetyltransferase
MEILSSRSINYTKDLQRFIDFWIAYRVASDVRSYPTTWRLRLLLTSRVWNTEKDTRIWETAAGHITGMAMLWRRKPRSPYLVLENFVQPEFATEDLLSELLRWVDQWANEIAQEQGGALTVYAARFPQHEYSARRMRDFGYTLFTPNPEQGNVYFARALQEEILHPELPQGYRICQLRNEEDIAAYQAAYGFAKVNPHHLKELIESDEYRHLLVKDAENGIASYCECSICRAEWEASGQRIGWIDYVETVLEQQGKGLGQAILREGLWQLKEWGATVAMLVTTKTNLPAIRLYQKTGFNVNKIEKVPTYEKKIEIQDGVFL